MEGSSSILCAMPRIGCPLVVVVPLVVSLGNKVVDRAISYSDSLFCIILYKYAVAMLDVLLEGR
jgi:hypothetical protein